MPFFTSLFKKIKSSNKTKSESSKPLSPWNCKVSSEDTMTFHQKLQKFNAIRQEVQEEKAARRERRALDRQNRLLGFQNEVLAAQNQKLCTDKSDLIDKKNEMVRKLQKQRRICEYYRRELVKIEADEDSE